MLYKKLCRHESEARKIRQPCDLSAGKGATNCINLASLLVKKTKNPGNASHLSKSSKHSKNPGQCPQLHVPALAMAPTTHHPRALNPPTQNSTSRNYNPYLQNNKTS